MLKPYRTSLLAACLTLGAGCVPLPLLQDARIVPDGVVQYGVGGGLIVSLDPDTAYEPDGDLGQAELDANGEPTKAATAERTDLQYIPLPYLSGWGRVGLGGGAELQVAFQLPSFAISIGGKFGLIGREESAPASLALSADITVSPVMVDWGIGGSIHTSFLLTDGISLDITGRFGTWVGSWNAPAITATLGLSIDGDAQETWSVVAGWAQPIPIPGITGRSIQAGFLGLAWSYR